MLDPRLVGRHLLLDGRGRFARELQLAAELEVRVDVTLVAQQQLLHVVARRAELRARGGVLADREQSLRAQLVGRLRRSI